MNKIIFTVGIAIAMMLMMLGVFIVSVTAHEITHVIESKNPEHISIDLQQPTYAHVKHDAYSWRNMSALMAWSEESEKHAYSVEIAFGLISSLMLGLSSAHLIYCYIISK